MIEIKDIYSAMGYGTAVPDLQVSEIVESLLPQALELSKPKFVYQCYPAVQCDKRRILIDDVKFDVGGIIGSYLSGMTQACVFIATAGLEYEQWRLSQKKDDILCEFVADSIGSVIAESVVDELAKELDTSFGLKRSLPYSPGYCAWNVAEQRKLFPLLPGDRCGVTLTESCLMHPIKSISGFFALGKDLVPQPYRCDLCNNKQCFKNR